MNGNLYDLATSGGASTSLRCSSDKAAIDLVVDTMLRFGHPDGTVLTEPDEGGRGRYNITITYDELDPNGKVLT